ncbi:MAG TPA: hypothetical protein VFR75_12360 [Solirubrobacterales bacterium]|nr:hypothetical protein [Solirubrobacterales bacterium]
MFDLCMLPAALLPHSPTPYITLMLVGFAVGILGHLTRARWLVAVGVALIFLGALLFPLLANVTTEDRPPPIEESRGGSDE